MRRLHPNGQELIAISEIQQVYKHGDRIPLKFFNQGGMQGVITPGTRVTALEVARAVRARREAEVARQGGCPLYANTQ